MPCNVGSQIGTGKVKFHDLWSGGVSIRPFQAFFSAEQLTGGLLLSRSCPHSQQMGCWERPGCCAITAGTCAPLNTRVKFCRISICRTDSSVPPASFFGRTSIVEIITGLLPPMVSHFKIRVFGTNTQEDILNDF